MPNFVLLTGAGFSKNWGGFVAREITNVLMSRLQNNPYLLRRSIAEISRTCSPRCRANILLQGPVRTKTGSMRCKRRYQMYSAA